MIFSHWNGKVSVRTQQYRLDDDGQLVRHGGRPRPGPRHRRARSPRSPRACRKARGRVGKQRCCPASDDDDRPFTVGYPQFPITQLPARDGVPHGNVQRSAKAPNCSFFTNWTSTDDRITWDVEVGTAGKYEAVIYYTCPAADVGSTVELSFNGSRVEGKVSEANDPPLAAPKRPRAARRRIVREGLQARCAWA